MTGPASDPRPHEERQPVRCCGCDLPLPITVSQAPGTTSLECAVCRAIYSGVIWDRVPEYLSGNVRIRKPMRDEPKPE